MDFLWHYVSEKEKQLIKEQAKSIMDSFSKKLSKINKKMAEPLIERADAERQEKNASECDENFRKIMFENAPQKNNNFVLGEKKSW